MKRTLPNLLDMKMKILSGVSVLLLVVLIWAGWYANFLRKHAHRLDASSGHSGHLATSNANISEDWLQRATRASGRNSGYYEFLPYVSKTSPDLPLMLPFGTIAPSKHEALVGSGFHNDYITEANRLFMVQFKNEPSETDYMSRQPVARYDEHVFVFHATESELLTMIDDPNIVFIDHYHPHYKLHQDVVTAYFQEAVTPETVLIITTADFSNTEAMTYRMQALHENATVEGPLADNTGAVRYRISGLTDRGQLFTYALHPDVLEVQLAK